MEEMVAMEEAVEVEAVATAVVAAATVVAATEVDVVSCHLLLVLLVVWTPFLRIVLIVGFKVAVDMEAVVATRPPWLGPDHLQKKHFRFKISIHAHLVLFCYAVLSIPNCIFCI